MHGLMVTLMVAMMSDLELTLKNLKILKNGVRKALRSHYLDMRDFYDGNIYSVAESREMECGSTCCIIGACPTIPGLEAVQDDFNTGEYNTSLNYYDYHNRIFPFLTTDEWEYLFGENNSNNLNHFIGRLNKFIEKINLT